MQLFFFINWQVSLNHTQALCGTGYKATGRSNYCESAIVKQSDL